MEPYKFPVELNVQIAWLVFCLVFFPYIFYFFVSKVSKKDSFFKTLLTMPHIATYIFFSQLVSVVLSVLYYSVLIRTNLLFFLDFPLNIIVDFFVAPLFLTAVAVVGVGIYISKCTFDDILKFLKYTYSSIGIFFVVGLLAISCAHAYRKYCEETFICLRGTHLK